MTVTDVDALTLYREALERTDFDAATVQAAGVGCGYCPRCLQSGVTTPIDVLRSARRRVDYRCERCGFSMPAAGDAGSGGPR